MFTIAPLSVERVPGSPGVGADGSRGASGDFVGAVGTFGGTIGTLEVATGPNMPVTCGVELASPDPYRELRVMMSAESADITPWSAGIYKRYTVAG